MKHRNLILAISTMLLLGLLASPAIAGDWTQFRNSTDKNAFTEEDGPTSNSTVWESYTWSNSYNTMGINTVPLVVGDYVYTKAADGHMYKHSRAGVEIDDTVMTTGYGSGYQNSVDATDGDYIYDITTGIMFVWPSLNCYDLSDDSVEWSDVHFTSSQYDQCSCPLLYDDGYLYTGTINLYNPDPSDATDDGSYYCLYACNGSVKWETSTTDNAGYHWAGACSVGDYICYGNNAGNVTLVEKETGDVVDYFDVTDQSIRSTCVYYNDGTDERIYFSTVGNNMTGQLYWVGLINNSGTYSFNYSNYESTSIGRCLSSASTPAIDVEEGVVYVGGSQCLHAMYADNLTTKWNHNRGCVMSSPVISDNMYDGKNVIYYTTIGTCYAILDEGSNCSVLFAHTPENSDSGVNIQIPYVIDNYICQGVAISDGQVFFGNCKGYLVGIGTSS